MKSHREGITYLGPCINTRVLTVGTRGLGTMGLGCSHWCCSCGTLLFLHHTIKYIRVYISRGRVCLIPISKFRNGCAVIRLIKQNTRIRTNWFQPQSNKKQERFRLLEASAHCGPKFS